MSSRPDLPLVSSLCRRLAFFRTALCAAVLTALFFAAVAPAQPWAATDTKTKTPAERTLQGSVESKGGAPVPHAVVYLQDSKSTVIRSYVSDDAGRFHFHQLSPDTDYDVWAELNGHRSKTKTISQFNSHSAFHFTLKLKG